MQAEAVMQKDLAGARTGVDVANETAVAATMIASCNDTPSARHKGRVCIKGIASLCTCEEMTDGFPTRGVGTEMSVRWPLAQDLVRQDFL